MDTEPVIPPLCPNCAKPMRFTRLIPALGTIPELYSYYCDGCGEAVTEVGESGERRDLSRYFERETALPRKRRSAVKMRSVVSRPSPFPAAGIRESAVLESAGRRFALHASGKW
jgi:hypothetical protein